MEVPTTLDCSPTRPRDCVQVPTGPAPPMPIRHAKVIILVDLPDGNEVAMIRNANYSIPRPGVYQAKVGKDKVDILVPIQRRPTYAKDGKIENPGKTSRRWVKYKVYAVLRDANKSPASKSPVGAAITAWQVYQSLSWEDKAYVVHFCSRNPRGSALLPPAHPAHVVDCNSWRAAANRK